MKNFYKTLFLLLFVSVIAFGQTNLIQNGNFESWIGPDSVEHWINGPTYNKTDFDSLWQESTIIRNGTYSVKLFWVGGSLHSEFHQVVDGLSESTEYTFSLWYRGTDTPSGERINIGIAWYDASDTFIASEWSPSGTGQYATVSNTWQEKLITTNSPTGTVRARIVLRGNRSDPGYVFIDDAQFLGPGANFPIITGLTTGHFDAGVGRNIDATITDNQGIDEAWLHFSTATEDSVQMSNIGGDIYRGTIPAQTNNTALQYWVSATDTDGPNYSISTVQKTIVGIADISRAHELDANGNMLYDNFLAKIKGVVTVATGTFSSTAQDDYMQDNTGGINIFDYAVIHSLALGDSAEVSGKFSSYNGKSEIVDFNINVLSPGNPVPAPTVITTVDMAEQYEGMLIRINHGEVGNWLTQPSDTSYDALFTTADGGLILRVDGDTDIGGNNVPQGIIDLIGIGSQYVSSSPYTEGYQIMPRSWADFLFPNSIEEESNTPFEFSLKQNYPNPFNPNTKIEYSLAKNSDVKMVIYNLLGQEIKSFSVLNLAKGKHHFNWNGKDNKGFDVASGIYIYRLTAGEFISTKKMALLR